MQCNAKVCRNAANNTTTTSTVTAATTITSQQQQLIKITKTTALQQIAEQQLQPQQQEEEEEEEERANNAIKTPVTHTNIQDQHTQQQQQQQQPQAEDANATTTTTTATATATKLKEEIALEKFIGGHSTPQVSDGSSSAVVSTTTTTTNAAPIPKQRSSLVAKSTTTQTTAKQLSTKEADSYTNSASVLPRTSLAGFTATAATPIIPTTKTAREQLKEQQQIVKGKVEKSQSTEQLQMHENMEAMEHTNTATTKTTTPPSIAANCGTYASATAAPTSTHIVDREKRTATPTTTSTFTLQPTERSTTVLGNNAGSPSLQSSTTSERDKSGIAHVPNALLLTSHTATTNVTNKFEKSTKIFSKLQHNQFIKNQAAAASAAGATAKYLKQQRAVAHTQDNGNSSKNNNNSSPLESKLLLHKKMVAVQELKKTNANQAAASNAATMCTRDNQATDAANYDGNEDLSYGPGIVSKLRCRYLSLALRESMEQQRHALNTLRRATSLNTLLDRDEPSHKHTVELVVAAAEAEQHNADGENQENLPPAAATAAAAVAVGGGVLRATAEQQQQQQSVISKKTGTYQQQYSSAAVANAQTHIAQSQRNGSDVDVRLRHAKRGNDSLKRARSVEALLCEKAAWNFAYNRSSVDSCKHTLPACTRGSHISVSIEDKISNARERLLLGTDIMPPRRLAPIIDDTERPPPDLVKQTLKKFEASANRRTRGHNRTQGSGEVANKVANYRSIIKEQKPAIVFPKPVAAAPLSPIKKVAGAAGTGAARGSPPKSPNVVATDLLSSTLGRKTTATAAAAATATATTVGAINTARLETSTPNKQLPPTLGVLEMTPLAKLQQNSSTTYASDNNAAFGHNNKLSHESVGSAGAFDSPVTALTKKLQKLQLHAAKQQQTMPQQQQQEETNSSAADEFVVGEVGGAGGDATSLVENTTKNSNNDSNDTRSHKNNSTKSDDNNRNGNEEHDQQNNNNGDDDDDDDEENNKSDVDVCCALQLDSVRAGTTATSIELSDNECGAAASVKRVSKTALENIARAGTSQQFRFGDDDDAAAAATATVGETAAAITAITGKQIGIIRPLHQRSTSEDCNNESFRAAKQQQHQHQQQKQQHSSMHTPSHINTHAQASGAAPALTTREIEKNRINEMKKTAATPAVSSTNTTSPGAGTAACSANNAASSNSSKSTASGTSELDAPNVATSASGCAAVTHNSSPLWALQTKKKRQPPAVVAENNCMVFNFSNRKEVPDYIENDGVVIRRKRELPKPNESGFVLLGDLSLETSTDSDYDDFSLCPPSPCDVEFENANVVIDGKSSIRHKSKESACHVQFNDTLTSTFEYPSEGSLILDDSMSEYYANEELSNSYESLVLETTLNSSDRTTTDSPKQIHHHVAVDEIIPLPAITTTTAPAATATATNNTTPTTKTLGNLALGSAPLGYYTPIKAPIENIFQLGVTRAPPHSHNSKNSNSKTNGKYNQTATTTTAAATTNGGNNGIGNGGGGGNDGDDSESAAISCNAGAELGSLQYLKPANDDLTIAYSEGAQRTDLLY